MSIDLRRETFRHTDATAAVELITEDFVLKQLKKLKKNILIREKNFNFLLSFFNEYTKYFKLPETFKNVKTPWLAFPLVIKKNNKFNRMELQIYLEKNNIQHSNIFKFKSLSF